MAFEEGACFPSASPFWQRAELMDADSEKAPHNKGFHLQYLFFDRTLWAFIKFFPLQITGKINARRYLAARLYAAPNRQERTVLT